MRANVNVLYVDMVCEGRCDFLEKRLGYLASNRDMNLR